MYSSYFIRDIISSQNPHPPLSANVSICLTPPPPFVSQCQHFEPPTPLAADLFFEQPRIAGDKKKEEKKVIIGSQERLRCANLVGLEG